MIRSLKHMVRSVTPPAVLSVYHFLLVFFAALLYGFPSQRITVIGVTGTKGKSSVIEFANAIFEAAGHTTAIASTVRFKIGNESKPNLLRMTMVGRLALQRFLNRAAQSGCTVAFVEMTSEGARQHRHRFIDLDALIFTNLAPEHIESHGSLAAYTEAKLSIGVQLVRSKKRPRIMVANADDAVGVRFLSLAADRVIPFSLSQAEPWQAKESGSSFHFDDTAITLHLPGTFSIYNALAAAEVARALGVDTRAIVRGLTSLKTIPGRAERVEEGQDFAVIVDYAHTPDSLRAIYDAYPQRRICVLGGTGGGRDMWKRPTMGAIADEYCEHIILTNEDPYDEDPRSIVDSIALGIKQHTPEILMDRREAIRRGIEHAVTLRAQDDKDVVVLITGKGTDPNICEAGGARTPWSDAGVAREELQALKTAK